MNTDDASQKFCEEEIDQTFMDYDPNLFATLAYLYLKFHERFLFKIQFPVVLKKGFRARTSL
jgi:hypothetical protein